MPSTSAYSFGCSQALKIAADHATSRDKTKKPDDSWKKYFVVGGVGIPLAALAAKVIAHSYGNSLKTPVQVRPQPEIPPIKIPPLDAPASSRESAPKSASDLTLGRVLGTTLAATGGGLLLGSYPGMKLQEMSEKSMGPGLVSFSAGKAPIIFAGSLSAGLYNFLQDQADKKRKQELNQDQEPESMTKYLKYLFY